jgi:hypothetical protein
LLCSIGEAVYYDLYIKDKLSEHLGRDVLVNIACVTGIFIGAHLGRFVGGYVGMILFYGPKKFDKIY